MSFPNSLYLLDKILLLIFISSLLSEQFLYFQNRIYLYVKIVEQLQYKTISELKWIILLGRKSIFQREDEKVWEESIHNKL